MAKRNKFIELTIILSALLLLVSNGSPKNAGPN